MLPYFSCLHFRGKINPDGSLSLSPGSVFPKDLAALFPHFIHTHVISACLRSASSLGVEDISITAMVIARTMFEMYRLELASGSLPKSADPPTQALVIKGLRACRFMRTGSGGTGMISFAHRCFAE